MSKSEILKDKKNAFSRIHFSLLIILFSLLIASCEKDSSKMDYQNPNQSIEERVEDLLDRMTLEEKFWQLYMIPGDLSEGKEKYKNGLFGFQISVKGRSESQAEQLLDYSGGGSALESVRLANEIQKYFVEETRLGIPIIPFSEALHGLISKDATSYPQAIGLAATWNTELMESVAHSIALETKSRGIRQILSPVINIARDVRWGRTEETYGEDPFLSSRMAVAFVSPFEEKGIITTPKHFIANVGDGGRDSYPIHFNERLMEEIYFPAFKACFSEGKSWSVMTSYNSLDGRPCTANDWLLNEKLKKEWGFNGFVISDAGATGGANVLHYTAADYAEATQQAIENGLDVIFQTSYNHYPLFYEAFEKGMIDSETIDEAVRRVLRAKFKLGLFENPYIEEAQAKKYNNTSEQKVLARKAAQESIVLLKNENKILPLDKEIKSMAIIGADANKLRLGGYSGSGNELVSVVQGLKNKLGNNTNIQYTLGASRDSSNYHTVPSENLFHQENGALKSGLKGEYFNNIKMEGEASLTRIDSQIDFRWTLFSPDQEKINYDTYSAKWQGKLVSDQTGYFEIGLEGDDGYRLYLNDELVIDNWRKQSFQTITKKYFFEEGEKYDIKLKFYETVGNVSLKLVWNQGVENNWKKEIEKAVLITKQSEAAVVVVGIEEGEFRDRAYLTLPGHQEELIQKLAKTGKPIIVVLVGGSAITMNNWKDKVAAILDVWYPGEQGGNAIADVLFGDYNPAGRLPITFPIHESQLPLYYNHKPTGRGDDYNNLTGKPLYPFGYGLSYTQFEYSDLKLSDLEISKDEKVTATFKIKNIGNYDGDEVVQLYIRDLLSSVARPIMELKGFQRVFLKKGETKELTFEINPELLMMLDENMNNVVEPGAFRIMIGASSNDMRLREILKVTE